MESMQLEIKRAAGRSVWALRADILRCEEATITHVLLSLKWLKEQNVNTEAEIIIGDLARLVENLENREVPR